MVLPNKTYIKPLILALKLCLSCLLPFSLLHAQSALLSVSSFSPSYSDSLENVALKSVDGPYLFREQDGGKMLTVIEQGTRYHLIEQYIDFKDKTVFKCTVNNKDQDAFTFQLMDKIKTPKSSYKQPEKLLAISDIEGNFNAFYSLLVANGVMDKAYNWTYGKGHLVLTGDFMDRGDNVTQVLWLIYKLEQEAEKKGGVVHFILGNHETLNLKGTTNYVDKKYIKLAQKYTGKSDKKEAYAGLLADNQELVIWMKSKNAMEKVGNTLFVHGGVSRQLVSTGFSIEKINEIIRTRLKKGPSYNRTQKLDENFIFASLGPLWYRGLVVNYRNYYKKASEKDVNRALRYFNVDHISIGHTTVKEVSADYGDKILRTDVKHSPNKGSTQSQALLILNKKLFKVDAEGNKVSLEVEQQVKRTK